VKLFTPPRIPEPELMDSDTEVEAYASAAAATYLEAIDRSFVEHLARLIQPAGEGATTWRLLDIGCGPGQIPIMMAKRWPMMQILGIDAGPVMIEKARLDATAAGVAVSFDVLRLGPQGQARLPFADAEFDIVTCNSVLHHLADPVGAVDEIARVARPEGAVLIRDLMRPTLLPYALHVRIFGRNYEGEMRSLYEASVHAAYTTDELQEMLTGSRLGDGRARVFNRGLTHAGIERPVLDG
jgi:2-polyprenyl-3-methyl-5-hydroxy-6-metoxy-1,4-benzoquinol methylase